MSQPRINPNILDSEETKQRRETPHNPSQPHPLRSGM
jgi:hypothetical protein